MIESFLSILCSEMWQWDSSNGFQIQFKPNGTGKLTCRAELNVWIAAEFEWKAQTSGLLGVQVDIHDERLVGQLSLEITLTRRRISTRADSQIEPRQINEALLTDHAFLPKTYNIRLERGSFLTTPDAKRTSQLPLTPYFALRLVFDHSPYPPRQEWREASGAPDAIKFWEFKEFYGRKLTVDEVTDGWGWGSFLKRLWVK